MYTSGLSNDYVENLCQILYSGNFLGVFPCDMLKNMEQIIKSSMPKQFCVIVNLDPSNFKGSHFISMSYSRPEKTLVIFDPLALKYNDPNVINFVIFLKANIKIDFILPPAIPIQHHLSVHCGYFTISHILSTDPRLLQNFTTFLSQYYLHNNLDKNDIICVQNIIDFIETYGVNKNIV